LRERETCRTESLVMFATRWRKSSSVSLEYEPTSRTIPNMTRMSAALRGWPPKERLSQPGREWAMLPMREPREGSSSWCASWAGVWLLTAEPPHSSPLLKTTGAAEIVRVDRSLRLAQAPGPLHDWRAQVFCCTYAARPQHACDYTGSRAAKRPSTWTSLSGRPDSNRRPSPWQGVRWPGTHLHLCLFQQIEGVFHYRRVPSIHADSQR
jgi:hypothetical protein